MKVILLQNIARIGQKYDVRDVPDGHALNYLIPRKLVEPATKQSLKRLEDMAGKRASGAAVEAAQFNEALEKLQTEPVVVTVAANEKGHMFKGMKVDDIAAAVAAKNITLSADCINLEAPIKELGTHEIKVQFGETKGMFTLEVAAEK